MGNPFTRLFNALLGRQAAGAAPAPADEAGPERRSVDEAEAALEARAWARREGLHLAVQWLAQNAPYFHRWKNGPDAAYLSPYVTHAAPAEPTKDSAGAGERVALLVRGSRLEPAWSAAPGPAKGGQTLHYQVAYRDSLCVRVRFQRTVDPEDGQEKERFDDFEVFHQGAWIDVVRHLKEHYDQARQKQAL